MKPSLAKRSRRGAVLLEVVFVCGLLTLFTGGALFTASAIGQDYSTQFTSSEIDEDASVASDEVSERLRAADLNAVFPPFVPGAFSTWIDYARVGLPGAAPTPERLQLIDDPADPDDGVDNDSDGIVDEKMLVWIQNPDTTDERRLVLARGVTEELEGETLGNLVDDNDNGLIDEAGACFEFQTGRVVFHLTLAKNDGAGRVIRRTVTRTTALRNTDIAP
jgi:hypothetical protein